MLKPTPIAAFVTTHMHERQLTRGQLANRLGQNPNKALRQLYALTQTANPRNVDFIQRLATALEVPNNALMAVVQQQHQADIDAADAAYRAHFTPHAFWKTQLDRPSSISMAAWINAPKRLLLRFPRELAPRHYITHCQNSAPEGVPLYGRVSGFTINYHPDHAVVYRLDGTVVKTLDRALRLATTEIRV